MTYDPFLLHPPAPVQAVPQAPLLDSATTGALGAVDGLMNWLVVEKLGGALDAATTALRENTGTINPGGALLGKMHSMMPSFSFNSGPSTTVTAQGRSRRIDGPELQRSVTEPSASVSQTHSFSPTHTMQIQNIAMDLKCMDCGIAHENVMSAAAIAASFANLQQKGGMSMGMQH